MSVTPSSMRTRRGPGSGQGGDRASELSPCPSCGMGWRLSNMVEAQPPVRMGCVEVTGDQAQGQPLPLGPAAPPRPRVSRSGRLPDRQAHPLRGARQGDRWPPALRSVPRARRADGRRRPLTVAFATAEWHAAHGQCGHGCSRNARAHGVGTRGPGPRDRARGSRMNRLVVGVVAAVGAISILGVAPASAAVPAAPVFSDGFESGGMAGYRAVTHSGVQQALVHTGSWAWRATNPNGVPSYAYRPLAGSYNELWASAWVYLASHSSTVKLFALRPVGQRSIDVYVDQRNRVSVRNNIGATTTYGTTTLANGGWHRVVLHAKVGAGTGSFGVTV